MRIFFRYIVFFSITHLFFAVFLFFGLGIFTQAAEEQHPFLYPCILWLCVIATLVQSLVFTTISYFIDIAGAGFFITALIVELLVANSLFFYSMGNQGYSEELTDSVLMNASLLAALFVTMLIKEYQAQQS